MMEIIEIVGQVLIVAATIAAPCLVILAFRSWANRLRSQLPRWRSVLGVTSILATLLGWVTFVGNFLLVVLRPWMQISLAVWEPAEAMMLTAGVLLAFALKSPSRPQVLLANLCMVFLLANTIIIN